MSWEQLLTETMAESTVVSSAQQVQSTVELMIAVPRSVECQVDLNEPQVRLMKARASYRELVALSRGEVPERASVVDSVPKRQYAKAFRGQRAALVQADRQLLQPPRCLRESLLQQRQQALLCG